MNRSILLFIFLLFSFKSIVGQVNLQTGSAVFSLPIFSWQDAKSRLNSIVALSYNSGNGLKVNEPASNVGQGWSLIAGGEIIRMQVGEPDDQVARVGNGSDYDISKYPPGILYATEPAHKGCPNGLLKYPIYGWKDQMYAQHNIVAEDRELDYFVFQFNGKSGMFVLDPTNIGTALPLGDTKMKITFLQDANLQNQGIRTKITSFKIEDTDGLIYKFTAHSLTKVLKTEFTDGDYNHKQHAPKFKNGKIYYQSSFEDPAFINPWIVSGWHLTEIEDALTNRKVFYSYENRPSSNYAGENLSAQYNEKEYAIVARSISVVQNKELQTITFPDGHAVQVNFGEYRKDFNGQKVVKSIDVTYQARYISRHELKTSYFILNRYGIPVSDYQKRVARLCLQEVRKVGVDLKEDTPPYKFDYYTGSSAADDFVPPPFFYAKDIWGFYNGDESKGYYYETIPLNTTANKLGNHNYIRGLCYQRNGESGVKLNPKDGYAKNGLMKQIIYPTGGTLAYRYAQNSGYLNGSERFVGGVHVDTTISTDGGYSNPCSNAIATSYRYLLEGGSASSLWGLETPSNRVYTENHYAPEWRKYKWSLSCFPFGCCYWKYQYPGIQSMQQITNLQFWQKAAAVLSPVMNIVSVLSTIQNVVTVFTGGSPVALIIDVIAGLANLALTCIGDQARNSSATVYYNFDLNSAAPLPLQFKRVEVIEGTGNKGKTIQEFTSDQDYAVWVPSNPFYTAKQRFAPWAYGLPTKTKVIDANGYIVKETENTYDFTYAKRILNYCTGGHGLPCNGSGLTTNLVSCKCDVREMYSQRDERWTNPAYWNPGFQTSSNDDMKVDFYGMYTGRVLLSSTTEKNYKQNSNTDYVQSQSSFSYNDGSATYGNFEPFLIQELQGNGDRVYKQIRYSGDFSGMVINTLNQFNLISVPIATLTYKVKNGASNPIYLSEKVTEYIKLTNGNILPLRLLEQRFSQPVASITQYAGPEGQISQYAIPQTFVYDVNSNLSGVRDEGGRTLSNIYDYDDKFIIATVINADPEADKIAYSSFETSSLGGWTVGGTVAYSTSATMTGSRAFVMSGSNSISISSLNSAKPHTISFWATSSISVSGGAVIQKSAPTFNGFTYYEYQLNSGVTSVTLSGSATVDELRIGPKMARFRTTTYEPLIGKTSECDENGRITYYEYDNLGRLRFIKDAEKNIVKMNEYNNVSAAKQNGCPGIYYNKLISEIFQRNNCGTGYEGSFVTYSVPASMFSSNLSQADADALAEQYLLANGQAYANTNGTCLVIYYNAAVSITDTTENCPIGYIGGTVTYTVPAGTYSSTVSQAAANQLALDDLEANADFYINQPPNAVCNLDTSAHWEWVDEGTSMCQLVNGVMHRFILEKDKNPNSSTYNTTRWSDIGPDGSCPPAQCTYNNCEVNEGYKCINDVCEQGVPVTTYSYQHNGGWMCVYHYEFSDGSWSGNYEVWNQYPCWW